MSHKIIYKFGDLINGTKFLYDIDNIKGVRCACFECKLCNKKYNARILHIKFGNQKGCGCLSKTHGLRGHRLYTIWHVIKQRCNHKNKHLRGYKYYGARGITICDKWKNDFKEFYDYVTSLPNYGKPKMELDRINNDGNYEPGNMRWATHSQQMRNRRSWAKNKLKKQNP